MVSPRWCTTLAVALCAPTLGCGEQVTLSDQEGWLALEYHCEHVKPVANSSAEHALVRDYAGRILYQASRDGTFDSVRPLLEADAGGAASEVERLVVKYLCEEVPIAPRGTVDSARAAVPLRGLATHVAAPDFIAPLLEPGYLAGDVRHLRSADLRGSYVVLNFWATYCGPCRLKHDDLVALANRYADRGVRVIGVLHREPASLGLEWLKQHPAGRYQTVVDESGRIASLYSVDGIPHTFLIDPSGAVAVNNLGIWTDSLVARLDALLGK